MDILPFRQYGGYWGLSQGLLTSIATLFLISTEVIFSFVTHYKWKETISFFNLDFYFTLSMVFLISQFIFNFYSSAKHNESVKIANELKEKKLFRIILFSFFTILGSLIYFCLYNFTNR